MAGAVFEDAEARDRGAEVCQAKGRPSSLVSGSKRIEPLLPINLIGESHDLDSKQTLAREAVLDTGLSGHQNNLPLSGFLAKKIQKKGCVKLHDNVIQYGIS